MGKINLRWWTESAPPWWGVGLRYVSAKGATAVLPVAPVDTSLGPCIGPTRLSEFPPALNYNVQKSITTQKME